LVEVKALPRIFEIGIQRIEDPMPGSDIQTVTRVLSAAYPEITTATMKEPTIKNGAQVFSFSEAIGKKG
jgi:PRTRC genetic system protein C